jgi:hypothetical protein
MDFGGLGAVGHALETEVDPETAKVYPGRNDRSKPVIMVPGFSGPISMRSIGNSAFGLQRLNRVMSIAEATDGYLADARVSRFCVTLLLAAKPPWMLHRLR